MVSKMIAKRRSSIKQHRDGVMIYIHIYRLYVAEINPFMKFSFTRCGKFQRLCHPLDIDNIDVSETICVVILVTQRYQYLQEK